MATPTGDPITQLVRLWGEVMFNDPPEKVDPSKARDAETVIKSQLTENTGTHFLDSGFDNGRHWQKNRENPPWERPDMKVRGDGGTDGYVVFNVYNWMERVFTRDTMCVALETALYQYGRTGDRDDDAWFVTMKEFPEVHDTRYPDDIAALGIDADVAERIAGIPAECPTPWNTYNSEYGDLSQTLQGVTVNGPGTRGEYRYTMLQVHQGADVRGGYTAPRVYKHPHREIPYPSEALVRCTECGWQDAESCLYDSERVEYHGDENAVRCADCGAELQYGI